MQRLIFSWCSFEIPSTLHNKLTLGGGSDEMAVERYVFSRCKSEQNECCSTILLSSLLPVWLS
jgi:hypothetical protein